LICAVISAVEKRLCKIDKVLQEYYNTDVLGYAVHRR